MTAPTYFNKGCISRLLLSFIGLLFAAYESPLARPLPEGLKAIYHAIPERDNFPGSVDSTVPRVSETLTFQLHPRDFSPLRMQNPPRNQKSTGLYLVPKESVIVTVQGASRNSGERRIHLRVGAHPFDLSNSLSALKARPPKSFHVTDLYESSQTIYSEVGGLIYVESDNTGSNVYQVTIEGAVKAPWFKAGHTTPAQWHEIRDYPAPWAELEGHYSILTLPSVLVRKLDDPTPITNYYDSIVKAVNTLVGLSDTNDDDHHKSPDLPFRFVMDIELYPLAASSNQYGITLSGTVFGSPAKWLGPGRSTHTLLHEMGHMYGPVSDIMGPPGANEAFADLILYGEQSRRGYWFLGNRLAFAGWLALNDDFFYHNFPDFFWSLAPLLERLAYEYDSRIWGGEDYSMGTWKRVFMMGLVSRLSHTFIPRLYREFRNTPENKLPERNNQQQKTDFFFETLCKAVEQDLTPYFRDWYVPVSEDAYQRVAEKGYHRPYWLYHHGL